MQNFTDWLFSASGAAVISLLGLAALLLAALLLHRRGPKKRRRRPLPPPAVAGAVNAARPEAGVERAAQIPVSIVAEDIRDSAAKLGGDAAPLLNKPQVEKEKFAAGTPASPRPSAQAPKTYDVFISYTREDEQHVRSIYEYLTDSRLRVWLDKENIKPGDKWLDSMQAGLECSKACVVFYRNEPGVWQQEETQHALRKRSKDQSFKIIPVLLPGGRDGEPDIPPILQGTAWVDLRAGLLNLKGLKRLVEAIRGRDIVPIHQVPEESEVSNNLPTGYKADVRKIISLLIGEALYSRRDVSIRELIQNAVDACERLGNSRFGAAARAEITINIDTEEGYFEVADNGDGMSPETLSEYFAVIGRSIRDEEGIMERAQGDEKTRAHLIGKFGIGFLSAYMLAKKILISTTHEGHEQINLEINGISDPFAYTADSQVGRAPGESGTTIRVYLKDAFLPGGGAHLDVTAAIQEFCRHVQYINVYKDGSPVAIRDTWNTDNLHIVDVTSVPFKFELQLGLSKASLDFFASNAGFLISRTSDPISPQYMPRSIGGEINFYPGIVELNMARDTIIENDKSREVRRLISKAIKNLLIRVAGDGDADERKQLRGILVAYLKLAARYEEEVRAQDSASASGKAAPYYLDSGPEAPPLSSIEAAELLMDIWEVEVNGAKVYLREGLKAVKEGGRNRVYITSAHYGSQKRLFNVIYQSLRKRGFLMVELTSHTVEYKSGESEWVSEREALEHLAKRYYFDLYSVERPFSEDVEDLTISKDILESGVKHVIHDIESSTGKPIRLSRLQGAPVVFQLAGETYLNVGSDLFHQALASFDYYDKSVMKSYILGLLQYEIR